MKDKVKALAKEYLKEITQVRRHLHAHPELSFKEYETSKFIRSYLDQIGVPYKAGYVETGIVAIIEGKNPGKKVIALRGDIDALPITEENEASYCSQNTGVMHACGHDVHTSSLMGVAKILNALKDDFEGTVKLIFQPGEEVLPGGASLMIKEGALKNPDAELIIGQHVFPEMDAGHVGFRRGMYMASCDEIYVTIKGKGGHAAMPQNIIDPILIASHMIVSMQQVVSRHTSPTVPSVLSFGRIEGLGVTNVIPDIVKMEGTFRTMDEEWRAKAHEIMQRLAHSVAEGMGGSVDFDIQKGYPFLVNEENTTVKSWKLADEFLGKENVHELDLRMTSEDFAFYSQVLPSCFYRLGVRNANKGITSRLHTSTFDIDESALETGMGLMSFIALGMLKEK
ncbi:MAG: M20 family metallopeptidase [Flavobacteriales bacterium]